MYRFHLCLLLALDFSGDMKVANRPTKNMTVYSLPLLYWTNVEYNMGMVAGSIGTLRPLFRQIYVSFSSLSGSGNSGDTVSTNNAASVAPPKRAPWRGGASRVQGDSVLLQTAGSLVQQLGGKRGRGTDAGEITLVDMPAAPGTTRRGGDAVHLVEIAEQKEATSAKSEHAEIAALSRIA